MRREPDEYPDAPRPAPVSLTYRRFQEDDLPGLLALWEAGGWGAIDAPTWRSWFLETPHGPATVIVALDDGDVAGQMMFTPSLLDAEGGPYRAVRVAAPVLHPDVRTGSARSPDHPAVRLCLAGIDAARDDGVDAVYSLPDRAWLPIFRWGVFAELFESVEVGCAARSLGGGAGPEWRAEPAGELGDEHQALWDAARGAFPVACGVRRTPAWLRYRLGGHDAFDVRERGALRGFAAVRRTDGLVMDAVAEDPDALGQTLAAVAHAAGDGAGRDYPALKAMRTEAWAAPLEAAGFGRDPYRFVLAVCPLSDRFPTVAADPTAWYATPSD